MEVEDNKHLVPAAFTDFAVPALVDTTYRPTPGAEPLWDELRDLAKQNGWREPHPSSDPHVNSRGMVAGSEMWFRIFSGQWRGKPGFQDLVTALVRHGASRGGSLDDFRSSAQSAIGMNAEILGTLAVGGEQWLKVQGQSQAWGSVIDAIDAVQASN